MKKLIMLLVIVGMLIVSGCGSVVLDGFSVGAVYLNSDITTTRSVDAGYFGEFTGEESTRIEGLMPTFSLNFRFK